MDLRPVFYISGLLLVFLALSMTVPMLTDIYFGNADWKTFFLSLLATSFFGGVLVLANGGDGSFSLSIRQGFLLYAVAWFGVSLFSALPFWLSPTTFSFTDALFESVSGITTTGATVIQNIESAPPGILIWRAILQWLGGAGVIITAMTILPMLRLGGMQIFQSESHKSGKTRLLFSHSIVTALIVYTFLTVACFASYRVSGLRVFDSVAHALSTVSTGGFSTRAGSLGAYDNSGVEWTAIVFMLLGALPFAAYLKFLKNGAGVFAEDLQIRFFIGFIAIVTITLGLHNRFFAPGMEHEGFREALFTVVSMITCTGFTSHDYTQWGAFAVSLVFFLIVTGGCAGSTTGGIKIFRLQVLYAVARHQLLRLINPSAAHTPQMGERTLTDDIIISVMGFLFLFSLCFTAIAILFSFTGLNVTTSLFASASLLSNAGPVIASDALSASGTSGFSDAAKWIGCLAMLLGRLELFTVFVLAYPAFWRQ